MSWYSEVSYLIRRNFIEIAIFPIFKLDAKHFTVVTMLNILRVKKSLGTGFSLCMTNALQMLNHFVKQGNSFTAFKKYCNKRKADHVHVWQNFVLLLLKFITSGEFPTKIQRFQCSIKMYHCPYKMVLFSLSILASNDNDILV